jgi:flagellar hook-associated protein 2
VAGVAADDVRRLFAMDGQSTNGGVSFVIGSSRTGAPSSPIQVDITQAAERAVVTAGTALAASTVIDGTNDTLAVTLDGAAATDVKIAHGTYTAEQLAAALETALNSNQALTGRQASVGLLSGALSIQSDSYGGSSEVTITGGTALAALGLTGNETDTGLDVAGSFIVDGVTETATGRGRLLVGADDNANTADLQLRVSLSASQVQAGVDAEVTVTRGVASKLDQVLGKILDPVSGRIKTVNDGFDDKIEALQKAIDRQNEFFEKQQQELIDQFTALETTIAQLQSTATYLSSQLTSVNQSKS